MRVLVPCVCVCVCVGLFCRWKGKQVKYEYVCNQLKAIRQDLTVQHVKTAFTVDVYETHARMSLEQGDITEMNQCQTQLIELYSSGIDGALVEFTAYGMLYQLYINAKYNQPAAELNLSMAKMAPDLRTKPAVKHAFEVMIAMQAENYHKFFQLYDSCPNMGGYVMDLFVGAMRHAGFRQISRGTRCYVSCVFLECFHHPLFTPDSSSDSFNCI